MAVPLSRDADIGLPHMPEFLPYFFKIHLIVDLIHFRG